MPLYILQLLFCVQFFWRVGCRHFRGLACKHAASAVDWRLCKGLGGLPPSKCKCMRLIRSGNMPSRPPWLTRGDTGVWLVLCGLPGFGRFQRVMMFATGRKKRAVLVALVLPLCNSVILNSLHNLWKHHLNLSKIRMCVPCVVLGAVS